MVIITIITIIIIIIVINFIYQVTINLLKTLI